MSKKSIGKRSKTSRIT